MQHIWLARLETLCRAEGLLWVSWHRRPPFYQTLPAISQFCTGSGLDIITEGPWGDSFFPWVWATYAVVPTQEQYHTTPEAPKVQPWGQQRKHLKGSSSTMKVPCLAVRLESATVRRDLLGSFQDVETALLMWCPEVHKSLNPLFPPGWLPSLAEDSGSSQSDHTPSSSRAAGLQPVAGETQYKLNQPIFKFILLLGIT